MNKINKEMEFSKYIFPKIKTKKWKKIRLIDTTNKKIKWSFTGGPFGSNLQSSDYTNDGIRVIQLQNIGDGRFNNDYKIYTSEKKANELLSCNIYPGEIIISKMGDPVGRACIVPNYEKRYVMCSDGIRVVVDESQYSKAYIYYAINSPSFRLKIFRNSTGSTRRRIGLDVLKNLEMLILKEKKDQEQIAECLQTLDDLILLEEQKLKNFYAHKTGLLQKLFIKDMDKSPKLRFPNSKGRLIKTSIKNICNYSTSLLSMNDINPKGKYKFYDANDFIGKTDSFASEKPYITILKDGAGVGRMRLLEGYTNFVGTMGMITNKNNCTIGFLYYLLNTINFNKYIVGGAIPHIYFKDYSLQDVIIPEQKQEQQKIADCLFSLDDLIYAQTKKIETLKLRRKGLLQGLFPSVEETKHE